MVLSRGLRPVERIAHVPPHPDADSCCRRRGRRSHEPVLRLADEADALPDIHGESHADEDGEHGETPTRRLLFHHSPAVLACPPGSRTPRTKATNQGHGRIPPRGPGEQAEGHDGSPRTFKALPTGT